MSNDTPRTFRLLFSIPQIDSAFMRNPAGGGRVKLDLDQACLDDVNAMLDEAVARAGVTFAAVVVMVEQESAEQTTDEPLPFGMKRRGKTQR